ncbi:MAG: glucoamylase family protein, partial [Ferruginibacter sp.]
MKTLSLVYFFSISVLVLFSCKKGSDPAPQPVPPTAVSFSLNAFTINNTYSGFTYYGINKIPVLKFSFFAPLNRASVPASVSLATKSGTNISFTSSFERGDSTLVIQPSAPLAYLSKYIVSISTALKSLAGGNLQTRIDVNFSTGIDSSRKFPPLTDNELLDLVQKQTFKYFWDFGHPVSGLARERNTSGETVTSGGSGFGIMSIVTAVSRNFITRTQGFTRMQTIVAFLKNTAQTFHGAYPHWLNGTNGQVIPFSAQDNGADLVETSYLIQGLLTARQYFSDAGAAETTLRNDINVIADRVEWDWFRNGGQNVLYWHWSPNFNWAMNFPVRGWNEALITYVMAASSTTHSIPQGVYTSGWKNSNSFLNGNTYYGYVLPLGPVLGGPLFFEHYSFLGMKPTGLSDPSANYATQTTNHTLINYSYCRANPNHFYGYSDSVWGLTASDIENGYTASSPTNDRGYIAPTAALSSFPYTPAQSMAALRFYYFVLGDKIWKDYGFTDAFSLHDIWFADSYLAIDQGPIICMIENYRSGLLWNLFTSCPEVK